MADTALPRTAVSKPATPLALGPRVTVAENLVLATILVLLTSFTIAAISPNCRHWFVLPVSLCGVLCLTDAIAWLRRQTDTFDPKALTSLVLLHGSYLSPLLHVALESYTPVYNQKITDWPHWFGMLGLLFALGLIAYKISQRWFFRNTRPVHTFWTLNDGRFVMALTLTIALSAIVTAVLQVKFGGLHKESEELATGGAELVHTSWLLMLGDPLPLLCTMGAIRLLTDQRRKKSLFLIAGLLMALVVAQFVIAGYRGSRSAIIYVLFLGTVMVHYRLRRISVGLVLVGFIFLMIAGYYYLFFKRLGTKGFSALESTAARKQLEQKAKISPMEVLLGDLSRAEVQAFLIYRLYEHPDRYRLRLGQTYFISAVTVVPRALWPTKPPGKIAAGTDLQYGEGSYSEKFKSSRVYGLLGESLLNFGTLGVPIVFFAFGALMGWYRRKLATLHSADARFYLVPLATYTLMVGTFADSDNIIFGLIKNGFLPTVVILYAAVRMALPAVYRR